VTRLCPFACKLCCMAAIHVKNFHQINLKARKRTSELSYQQKIEILDQLDPDHFSIDFSGGDPLIDPQNINLILYASKKLGAGNIGVSTTGEFIDDALLKRLRGNVRSIDITLDFPPSISDPARPLKYGLVSLNAIKKLVQNKIDVDVHTVLRPENSNEHILSSLFNLLSNIGVQKWSLLRLFPVGSYFGTNNQIPTEEEYSDSVGYLKKISLSSRLELHFQYLLPQMNKSIRCRAVNQSIGITPSGIVTSCFWAINKSGKPLLDFRLGNVPKENIYDILASNKANRWRKISQKRNFCELQRILSH